MKSSVGNEAVGEICESAVSIEGSWPHGSNEYSKTVVT